MNRYSELVRKQLVVENAKKSMDLFKVVNRQEGETVQCGLGVMTENLMVTWYFIESCESNDYLPVRKEQEYLWVITNVTRRNDNPLTYLKIFIQHVDNTNNIINERN